MPLWILKIAKIIKNSLTETTLRLPVYMYQFLTLWSSDSVVCLLHFHFDVSQILTLIKYLCCPTCDMKCWLRQNTGNVISIA